MAALADWSAEAPSVLQARHERGCAEYCRRRGKGDGVKRLSQDATGGL
jgi:hypothetical protein